MFKATVRHNFSRQSIDMRCSQFVCKSADDLAGISIFDMVIRFARSTPHFQIRPEKKSPLRKLGGSESRQINPRHGWMFVMRPVPVVIQPESINWPPEAQISRAACDMTFSPIVVDVLHGGPGKTKSEIHHGVIEQRNFQRQNNHRVQKD